MKKKNFINYCGLLGVAAFISYGFVEIKPLKVGGRISIEANCCMEWNRNTISYWGCRNLFLLMYGLVICCFAAARDGLDKTIQAAVDGSCIPGIFPLISIPTIVGCIGAAMIIVAAVATPIAKSQRMREIWFYVMSSGVMLKVVVMELARIIQFI